MNTINRENAILSSFLWSDDTGIDKSEAFILDENIFTSSFRRDVAAKINDETKGEKYYGFLNVTLSDHTLRTKHELEFMDITAQSSMPFSVSKRYHTALKKEYMKRKAGFLNG